MYQSLPKPVKTKAAPELVDVQEATEQLRAPSHGRRDNPEGPGATNNLWSPQPNHGSMYSAKCCWEGPFRIHIKTAPGFVLDVCIAFAA